MQPIFLRSIFLPIQDFFFIRVSCVSTPLKRVDAEIAEAEDSNSRFALRIATLEYWIVNETGCNKWLGLHQVAGTKRRVRIDDFVNTHSYDAMNRRVQTTQTGTATGNAFAPKTEAVQYNAASQVTDIRRYNAVSPVGTSLRVHTRNDIDNAGRLAGVTHARQELANGVVWNGLSNTSSVGIVAAYRFAYDSDNRLTQFSSFADNLRTNYSYDRVDQLTGTSTSIITGMVAPFIPTNESYSYDATGNGQEAMRWVDSDGSGTGQILRLTNRYLWADSCRSSLLLQ